MEVTIASTCKCVAELPQGMAAAAAEPVLSSAEPVPTSTRDGSVVEKTEHSRIRPPYESNSRATAPPPQAAYEYANPANSTDGELATSHADGST
eukprot:scaffold4676_cov94-Isochrysis_galbana.AAC.6